MQIFHDVNELVNSATALIAPRFDSLEHDVAHCLSKRKGRYAPLPAIEYCFSIIDLMGALYKGEAGKEARTTEQAHAYMIDFMNYTDEHATLLQRIFRHKIVHLAMPKSVIEHKSKSIGWQYVHNDPKEHLKLIKLQQRKTLSVTGSLSIKYEYLFSLSIKHFANDIINSAVKSSNGYLARLKNDPILQANFEKALVQIYDPWQ